MIVDKKYIHVIVVIFTYKFHTLNVKLLATLVEGVLKTPLSTATTPRCREGCYSIPWIAPLYP